MCRCSWLSFRNPDTYRAPSFRHRPRPSARSTTGWVGSGSCLGGCAIEIARALAGGGLQRTAPCALRCTRPRHLAGSPTRSARSGVCFSSRRGRRCVTSSSATSPTARGASREGGLGAAVRGSGAGRRAARARAARSGSPRPRPSSSTGADSSELPSAFVAPRVAMTLEPAGARLPGPRHGCAPRQRGGRERARRVPDSSVRLEPRSSRCSKSRRRRRLARRLRRSPGNVADHLAVLRGRARRPPASGRAGSSTGARRSVRRRSGDRAPRPPDGSAHPSGSPVVGGLAPSPERCRKPGSRSTVGVWRARRVKGGSRRSSFAAGPSVGARDRAGRRDRGSRFHGRPRLAAAPVVAFGLWAYTRRVPLPAATLSGIVP